ncbi:MAG: phage portal protein, partial [Gammaproteobacteria bacterium]|nr:phage portal protein [Gammaproteobacteria bacterium]
DKATNIKLPLYKSSLGYKSNEWYRDAETGVERICVWIKNDFEGYDHYGLPSYVAALVSTQCEYQGARYNLDNFENNMVVGGALTITGSVSQEEAQRIATDLMNTHTGNGKRGRITVIATEGGLTDSKYEKHDTFEDGSYIELDDKSTQKIILANEWDATLAGLQQSGSMGKGNEYVKAIYEQKVATVIKPMHRLIKDRFFNVLKEIGAAWLSPAIAQYDLDIKVMDLFKDSSKITGTKEGVEAIMGILDRVSAKTMTPEQAISLVAWQWNLTPTEAAEKLAFVKNK